MDRFIAAIDSGLSTLVPDLKSNMDRFIGRQQNEWCKNDSI